MPIFKKRCSYVVLTVDTLHIDFNGTNLHVQLTMFIPTHTSQAK